MKSNKEIVTEIIEDLELHGELTFLSNTRVKITKERLRECWSEYRKEHEYIFYGYSSKSGVTKVYRKLFSIDKDNCMDWKNFILKSYGYKYCNICHNLLYLANFTNDAEYRCSTCKNEKSKDRYEENKEEILERTKLYKAENKEYISEKGKEYYQKNKDKILSNQKEYRVNNKEKIK